MRIAQIRGYDVANGIGIRTVIFVSGCTHNCKGCFNQLYMDFNYGELWNQDHTKKIIHYLSQDMVDGLTILGGEPFQNLDGLIELVAIIKSQVNKNIWIYSGYTFEQIISDAKKLKLLKLCDVLVDGLFDYRLKDLNLRFRGSSNQRIIDIQKSLLNDSVILFNLDT